MSILLQKEIQEDEEKGKHYISISFLLGIKLPRVVFNHLLLINLVLKLFDHSKVHIIDAIFYPKLENIAIKEF